MRSALAVPFIGLLVLVFSSSVAVAAWPPPNEFSWEISPFGVVNFVGNESEPGYFEYFAVGAPQGIAAEVVSYDGVNTGFNIFDGNGNVARFVGTQAGFPAFSLEDWDGEGNTWSLSNYSAGGVPEPGAFLASSFLFPSMMSTRRLSRRLSR